MPDLTYIYGVFSVVAVVGSADDVVSIKARVIPAIRGVYLTLTLRPGLSYVLLQSRDRRENVGIFPL